MKINELRDSRKSVSVEGQIILLGQTVDGAGWTRADATLKDESGTITLILWDKDNLEVSKGDVISIENGYVKNYQGTLQLSRGKYGKLTVLKSSPLPEPKGFTDTPFLITAADAIAYIRKLLEDLEKDCRSQSK